MTLFPAPAITALLIAAILTLTPTSSRADWVLADEAERSDSSAHPGLSYVKRTLRRRSDGKVATVQLSFFNSRDFKLKVIDLGGDSSPIYPSVRQALTANGCVAGVNGGFFHPGYRPIGLVIADGRRIHKFEIAKLLSGVVYCDHDGIHIVRRTAFKDHPQITALLQTGPYLIEHSQPVRGLSTENPRRRTFIATDWRRNWAIGTSSSLSLNELADLLHSSQSVTGWTVNRAINLDGGSSSAFFYDRPSPQSDVTAVNWKRIRNVLGVIPKQ